jgi:twitching motility protein PilT
MKNEFDVSNLTFEITNKIKKYLKKLIEVGGSDLHVKANSLIRARVHGEIIPFSAEIISKTETLTLAKELLRRRFLELVENKDIDLVFVYDENTRFRVNIFFQMDGVTAVFRIIPSKIKTIDELALPSSLHRLARIKRGLVLITGVTGSGKSTTLAAIINEINNIRKEHIITVEDPVEFIHKDKKCIINQRSLGQDTMSFSRALRAALREDPDIIMVGEMRDIETIEMALHAAETGHLVFSTLHTMDVKETINRIISVFPKEEQNRIRIILASVLQAIVSQRLVRTKKGGRIAAAEVMFKTKRIEKMIEEKRENEIIIAIEEGKIYGMRTFDYSLLQLYQKGIITEEEALNNATSRNDLKLKLQGIKEAKSALANKNTSEDIIDLKI